MAQADWVSLKTDAVAEETWRRVNRPHRRLRLAALTGDSMTQQPMVCTVGEETWRAKESKVNQGVPAAWGSWKERSVHWEVITAATLIQSGADIVVLRHPESVSLVKKTIASLMA